jgi:hypothetical protein
MKRDTPIRIDRELLRSRALPDSDGDKSERGTVLVVGGARQTPGAVLLAAETALRVGAGKVQVATAQATAAAVGVALPEAFVEALPVLRNGELAVAGADRVIELAATADVVLVGPGMGDPECADLFLAQVVPRLDVSVVLDALGTAYLTSHPDGVRHLTGRVLLTPNVTEVAAMLGRAEEDVEQDLRGLHVSYVSLPGIDTPIYRQAGYAGGPVGQPPPVVWSAAKAGRLVAHVLEHPRPVTHAGAFDRVTRLGFVLLPRVFDALVGPLFSRLASDASDTMPPGEGNVRHSVPSGNRLGGGHGSGVRAALGLLGGQRRDRVQPDPAPQR